MRAKLPTADGFVERDGVKLYFEAYGEGPETIVFIPPWSFAHSRIYKAQLPYFSERFRCITYDGRGNGKSDRPAEVAAYSLDNYVADALAVMDATKAGPAIIVGLSFGGMLASVLAAHHPERVKAAILIGTVASIGTVFPYLSPKHFFTKRETFEGWDKFNRQHWLTDYPDFAEYFTANICSEPHSTRQIEDGVAWASDTSGDVLVKTVEARAIKPDFDISEAMYRKIHCPVLMIHGDNDQIQPHARAQFVSEVIGAEFITIAGGGHNPLGRVPAKANALISDFLDRRLGIQASVSRAGRTGNLFFWRDRTREVDFVADIGGRVELYEAKWTELPSAADAINLEFLRGIFGASRVSSGAIVCRARNSYPLESELRALSIADIV